MLPRVRGKVFSCHTVAQQEAQTCSGYSTVHKLGLHCPFLIYLSRGNGSLLPRHLSPQKGGSQLFIIQSNQDQGQEHLLAQLHMFNYICSFHFCISSAKYPTTGDPYLPSDSGLMVRALKLGSCQLK